MVDQIHDGEWLSKPLLAAKSDQGNVNDIADFVWRFCVNYIALNAFTKIIVMPIPRCDEAVNMDFARPIWTYRRGAFYSAIKLHDFLYLATGY